MSEFSKRPRLNTILDTTSEMTSLFTTSSPSSFTTTIDPLDHPFYHPSDSLPWLYHNVLASAPMVRISTLPFRLACKSYGANMLYSEELVALKLQHCTRITNLYDYLPGGDLYQSIDNVSSDNTNDTNDINDNNDIIINSKLDFTKPTQQFQPSISPSLTHFILDKNVEGLATQLQKTLTKDSTTGSFITPTELPELTDPTQLLSQYYKYTSQEKTLRQLSMFTANSELTTYQHERLVVQLGAGDAVDALNAALVVQNDCKAIDINLGCPKLFSTQALFGSELLIRPEIVEDIVKTLKRNISNPVTVKIRMLPDPKHTIDLIRRVEACGVEAIAIHARYKADRPRYQALPLEQMPLLCSVARVPLLYNGDIYSHHEIDQYKHICRGCWCSGGDLDDSRCTCGSEKVNANGVHGVLIGRGAMHNPSIFGHYLEDPRVYGPLAGVQILNENKSQSPGDLDEKDRDEISDSTIPTTIVAHPSVSICLETNAKSNDDQMMDNDDVGKETNLSDNLPRKPSSITIENEINSNQSPQQTPPAMWDPVISLLHHCPTVGHFIPSSFLTLYQTQFTQPNLFTQRKKYHLDYQSPRNNDSKLYSSTGRSGLLDKGNITKTMTKPTTLEPYQYTPTITNTNPLTIHLKTLQNNATDDDTHGNTNNISKITHEQQEYQDTLLFSHSTWPSSDGKLFTPPKRSDWIELLNEIDQSIELRNRLQKAIDTVKQNQNQEEELQPALSDSILQTSSSNDDGSSKSCYDEDSTPCLSSTAITMAEVTTSITTTNTSTATTSAKSTSTYAPDDYSLYKHRSPPYQHNDPSLNPWKPWKFGQSYYSIGFMAPIETPNTRQKQPVYHQKNSLPMFFPASLITALALGLSLQINNIKYIVNALLKWNPIITKDDGFRKTSQAKTSNDLWKALMHMIQSPVTRAVLLDLYPHPQPLNKHEIRPEPKLKKK